MLQLLRGSGLIHDELEGQHEFRGGDEPIQDRYSLRCLPQYMGPIVDGINLIASQIEIDAAGNTVSHKWFMISGQNADGDQTGTVESIEFTDRNPRWQIVGAIQQRPPSFSAMKVSTFSMGRTMTSPSALRMCARAVLRKPAQILS